MHSTYQRVLVRINTADKQNTLLHASRKSASAVLCAGHAIDCKASGYNRVCCRKAASWQLAPDCRGNCRDHWSYTIPSLRHHQGAPSDSYSAVNRCCDPHGTALLPGTGPVCHFVAPNRTTRFRKQTHRGRIHLWSIIFLKHLESSFYTLASMA
jgi:hypothetical protein